MRFLALVGLVGLLAPVAEADIYDDTVAGKECHESSSQQLICNYQIGPDLRISITGIGAPDARIDFEKSDIETEYYAVLGILHGCIIINPGRLNSHLYGVSGGYAFISPMNGKVYRNWIDCQKVL